MTLIGRIFGGREALPAAVPARARVEPQMRASAESVQTGTARPAIWALEGFGGQSRVKGLPPVSPMSAQRHATVFACCNNIAGDLAKLPLEVWQRDARGREVRVPDHPANYLLNVEASPGVAAMVARFALTYAFTLRGKAFAWAPRDGGGELVMLDLLKVDSVSELQAARARFYDFEDGDGVFRRSSIRTMVHLRYMAEDGWTGRSPIQVAAESMGLALAGQEAAARSASGTITRAYVKMADNYEDEEAYRRNARRIADSIRNPEANGLPILSDTDDIKTLDMSAADQQLLDSRKMDREQIAAMYRMPPSKLQMLEYGVKANGEQQAIDYRSECLSHWGGFVESQMGMTVLTEAERRKGLVLRHDYDALMTATTKERFDALRLAVGGPWMHWEEARESEGLPALEGDKRPYPPPNMTEKPGATDQKEGADK